MTYYTILQASDSILCISMNTRAWASHGKRNTCITPSNHIFHRITQNCTESHRITGVGRDVCGSSSPTRLPKQGHLEQVAQDLVQVGFKYLQRRRFHNPSVQPVPVLHQPQREEVLTCVELELPMLQSVSVAPCPVFGHHWKESGPVLLTPTLEIFISFYKVPSQPSLLQAEQAQHFVSAPCLWTCGGKKRNFVENS